MLRSDEVNKDLGSIKFGKIQEFSYSVTNEGNEDITIRKVVVSCASCTIATASKNKVKAGETIQINVTFTPGTLGLQKKGIDVLYNNEKLKLEFKAQSHA